MFLDNRGEPTEHVETEELHDVPDNAKVINPFYKLQFEIGSENCVVTDILFGCRTRKLAYEICFAVGVTDTICAETLNELIEPCMF